MTEVLGQLHLTERLNMVIIGPIPKLIDSALRVRFWNRLNKKNCVIKLSCLRGV
jgi:hypothetical protein